MSVLREFAKDTNLITIKEHTIEGDCTVYDKPGTILMLGGPVLDETLYNYCVNTTEQGHMVNLHVGDVSFSMCKPADVKDVWCALGIMSEL